MVAHPPPAGEGDAAAQGSSLNESAAAGAAPNPPLAFPPVPPAR